MRLLNNKTVYFQIYIIHFELIVYTILKMKHVYIHYYSCNDFTQQSKQKTPVNYELVQKIMGIPQYAMSNVFIRPVKHSLCYSIKEQICHLPAGCRSLWKICMSMGKCNLLRTISTLLPVNLLALLILLVCQSVQYNSSSNKVRANG